MQKQIDLAYRLKLPMVFHIRDAMGDFLDYVRCNKDKFKHGAEIHSFSGSLEVAKELISYGFYLGFNGIITFKNANKILAVVKNIPLENILIETYAPYLTPEPHRGKVNEPKYTHYVAQKIADLKNINIEQVYKTTTDNAYTLFKKLRKD
jgi:TatD DNase family protein